MSDSQRAFKGVWIPASLWNHPQLSWFEKALVAEVDALSGAFNGPCFASLDFLAERMDSTPKSISNTLSKLTLLGVLKRLKSDGRFTYRCVVPAYSSDPGLSQTWISDGFNPGVECESTPGLTQPQLLGGPEISNIDTSIDGKVVSRAHVRARPDSEEAVIAYCQERGLAENDGSYMWNHWLANGFTNGGRFVKDWKAEIRTWQAGAFFPSQRPQPVQRNGHSAQIIASNGWKPPTKEQVMAYCESKGWALRFGRHCWNTWIANGWKHYGTKIESHDQWKSAMAVMEMPS